MAGNEVFIRFTDKGTNKTFTKNTEGSDRAVNKLVGSATKLVVGLATLQTAMKAIEFAELAARAKDVEKAFNSLADSAQIDANRMLKSMKDATAGTISEFELMQQFSTASLLGLPLDRFDEMLAIARGASKATGQSMEFMLNSIVTALGRGSKLMLDNLGILIDVGAANNRYAESLGKTSSQLTDVERKQAFINDALRIGGDNLKRIGELADSDADSFAQFTAEVGNLKVELGAQLLPVIIPVVKGLTDLVQGMTNFVGAGKDVVKVPIIDSLTVIINRLFGINREFLLWTERQRLALEALVDLGVESAQFTDLTDEAFEAIIAEGEAIDELVDAEMAAEQAAFDLANEELNLAAAALEAAEAQRLLKDEITGVEGAAMVANEIMNLSNQLLAGELENIRIKQEAETEAAEESRSAALASIEAKAAESEAAARRSISDEKLLAQRLIEINKDKAAKLAAAEATFQDSITIAQQKGDAARASSRSRQKPAMIAQAVANTALGITQALATEGIFGIITGALIAAAGAVQVSNISAQQFARGTNFAPGGLALVGEEGPELMNVPRGAQISTAAETKSMMDQPFIVQVALDSEVVAEVLVTGSEEGRNRIAVT